MTRPCEGSGAKLLNILPEGTKSVLTSSEQLRQDLVFEALRCILALAAVVLRQGLEEVKPRMEVNLLAAVESSALDELPRNADHGRERNDAVVEDEGRHLPVSMEEDCVALQPEEEKRPPESPVACKGLPARPGRQERFPIDALRLHGGVETDPSHGHDGPVEHGRCGAEIQQPVEHLRAAGAQSQVSQARQEDDDDDGHVRDAVPV